MSLAFEAIDVTKKFGRVRALDACTFSVPAGRIVGLVGPNGAGKTTLLHIAIGLNAPTAGRVEVFGTSAAEDVLTVLSRVGFVAQERPLYRGFTVGETLELGRRLNARWDAAYARRWVENAGIALEQRVETLSGGERAQVALSLALGKRPALLLLDEPLGGLDPLARRALLQELMSASTESEATVILTSHEIAAIERTCDYLVILGRGRVELAGDIEAVVGAHLSITAPPRYEDLIKSRATIVDAQRAERQISALVRVSGDVQWPTGNGLEVRPANLEELVLAYLRRARAERTAK
ncbi:MAG TPA: ABC transporter ATP-binding protein [Candidatus Dormibacteraeota bacterium]|jgi:ABC-2 type transport system ATP-binding protein|nr:ABC transporter ATP-binding protein [Candidatus Dormibacteraeota bacterium]